MNLINKTILVAACVGAFASCKKDGGSKDITTPADKASYGIGVDLGEKLKQAGLDSIDPDLIAQGIKDMMAGGENLKMNKDTALMSIQTYLEGVRGQKSVKNKEIGDKFLAENKTKQGVVTLPSGLQYQVIKEGTGVKPGIADVVTTHYHGTLIDGKVFDSSVDRGEPATFPVNGVIPGWTEALQLMPEGSKWRLFVPAELAYGPQGTGGDIGPNTTLIFDVELLKVQKQDSAATPK